MTPIEAAEFLFEIADDATTGSAENKLAAEAFKVLCIELDPLLKDVKDVAQIPEAFIDLTQKGNIWV